MTRRVRAEAELPDWPDVDTSYMETDSFRFTFRDGRTVTQADLDQLYEGVGLARRSRSFNRSRDNDAT